MTFSKSLKIQKIIRFIKSGLLMRGVAFVNNFIFVKNLGLPVHQAYYIVLAIDFIIGFFLNYKYVFESNSNTGKSFLLFLSFGLAFRLIDSQIYFYLYKILHNIMLSQIIVTAIMLVIKFFTYDKIFKKESGVDK